MAQKDNLRCVEKHECSALARFDYDAYGNILDEQIFATSLISEELARAIVDTQPLRYAGYVWDAETSLYYCSQRYYDPTIGAFISKDPIKADGELSAYIYCAGDPIGMVDPSGLDSYRPGTSDPYYCVPSKTYYWIYKYKKDQAVTAQRLVQAAANWRQGVAAKKAQRNGNYYAYEAHRMSGKTKVVDGSTYYQCSHCQGFFGSDGNMLEKASLSQYRSYASDIESELNISVSFGALRNSGGVKATIERNEDSKAKKILGEVFYATDINGPPHKTTTNLTWYETQQSTQRKVLSAYADKWVDTPEKRKQFYAKMTVDLLKGWSDLQSPAYSEPSFYYFDTSSGTYVVPGLGF